MTLRYRFLLLAAALSTLLLCGCGLLDSGVIWRGGPYALMWIDLPDEPFVARDEGRGSWTPKVEAQVFSVGWNGRYLVAKRHPKKDRTVTEFYFIDSSADRPFGRGINCIFGPMTEPEFERKKKELDLPDFSKTLESLE
jgi:hypothetical protein